MPTWANYLDLAICTGGGSGGGGRRGAAGTARSGGAGGQHGIAGVFRIALRNSLGALLANTATLTVADSVAGGAGATTNDTNGSNGLIGQTTTFTFAGTNYQLLGGGVPASGGGAGPAGSGSNATGQFPAVQATQTSVTAPIGLGYPSGFTAPGNPGGSISSGDVLLTVAGQSMAQGGGGNLQSMTPGANGTGYLRGLLFAAVGGMGGASSITAAAGNGGNGIYGSGGGGGGASLNGFASGAGGRGGAGWAVLQWGL